MVGRWNSGLCCLTVTAQSTKLWPLRMFCWILIRRRGRNFGRCADWYVIILNKAVADSKVIRIGYLFPPCHNKTRLRHNFPSMVTSKYRYFSNVWKHAVTSCNLMNYLPGTWGTPTIFYKQTVGTAELSWLLWKSVVEEGMPVMLPTGGISPGCLRLWEECRVALLCLSVPPSASKTGRPIPVWQAIVCGGLGVQLALVS